MREASPLDETRLRYNLWPKHDSVENRGEPPRHVACGIFLEMVPPHSLRIIGAGGEHSLERGANLGGVRFGARFVAVGDQLTGVRLAHDVADGARLMIDGEHRAASENVREDLRR